MPKKATVKPTYMKGKRPLKIALHDIVTFVKMIDDHNQIDAFQMAAKMKKAFVSVDAETVNFVKDYIVKNNLHEHPVGKHIVNARGLMAAGDRFDCNFGTGNR
jgi:hypothetical protein